MDCLKRKLFRLKKISLMVGLTVFSTTLSYASTGYFQLHNIMSAAQKNLPSNFLFNDAQFNLENLEKGTGHTVNTQFANNGGMAGCGVTSTLVQYMYQNAGTNNLSANYIALNVYSQIMGFDPQAPFWGDPEGQVKGYLTQGANIAYPYTPYHRVIPSIYPAYLGTYNNGLNCGRWVEADFDTQSCLDRTTPTGISKSCPTVSGLTYSGQKMQAYVFDSCEDNNGWCRDDATHIDVDGSAFTTPANYYLQWKFIRNPYYASTTAPASLKDIWLAWFSEASQYWSYVAILNAENGISNVQYNIGALNNPTWINSHVLAGDNNVTWSSTSNNGQLWQVEPVNSLTDAAPAANPVYQMRFFDYLGYPANHGSIYQFNLLFADGTLGQSVSGYYFFYQGGATVKSGTQAQNMTLLASPVGTGRITVAFNTLLPTLVGFDPTQTNYLRPVIISDDGYAWDATQCQNNKCVFINLPTNGTYHVFAHYINDVSNDLTLRKVNDIAINSGNITFPANTTLLTYTLSSKEINLSTLYSARVQIPLKFATTNSSSINANLQALFIPNASKNAANNITAQTQGCFLNTYINTITDPNNVVPPYFGNNSTCTVYYTVNNQTNFNNAALPAYFNVVLANNVGVSPVNFALDTPYNNAVQITGYDPTSNTLPTSQIMPLANYIASNATTRSLYLVLDEQSDAACLQNLDPTAGVSVNVGSTSPAVLTQAGQPLEIQLGQTTSSTTATANLVPSASIACQAQPAIPGTLTPGIDVVQVIKLVTSPVALPPKPATQGIAATATGDSACLGGADTLSFSTNNNVVTTSPYTTSSASTNVNVSAPLGTYTISDAPFNVAGGSCKLSSNPTFTLQNNVYTPVTLNYQFSATPGSTCTAVAQVTSTWPNGCNVQFTLSSTASLNNVTLFWVKGNVNWTPADVWSGEGSLNIPTGTGNVSWALPSWVNGQGSVVGMTINNDSNPGICAAFSNGLSVQCSGVTMSKAKVSKVKVKKRR